VATRILHILSQQPSRTGSGVTLDAIARLAEARHWHQAAVVGVPVSNPQPQVGNLPEESIFPVTFAESPATDQSADLPFPVPGMSDVMPYPSSVWSRLSVEQLERYRWVWKKHLAQVIARFKPDVIHSNHLWLVSSLLPQIAPDIPKLATCHATGLRQMHLCPHLKNEVVAGCSQLDRILALRQDHKEQLVQTLGIHPDRVTVVGVGFREDVFHCRKGVHPDPRSILYVGKYSRAKGLPWLLEAFAEVSKQVPGAVLHVAGDGAGEEADKLRQQMKNQHPGVLLHGQLGQHDLANLMRRCQVCVLPSFYEGVPLVLAEAAACGCRIVATDLPGVEEQLTPYLGPVLHKVATPPLQGLDTPDPAGLPAFVNDLQKQLKSALSAAENSLPASARSIYFHPLTWSAVFDRVETTWKQFQK